MIEWDCKFVETFGCLRNITWVHIAVIYFVIATLGVITTFLDKD